MMHSLVCDASWRVPRNNGLDASVKVCGLALASIWLVELLSYAVDLPTVVAADGTLPITMIALCIWCNV
jgi:hypothetical protein